MNKNSGEIFEVFDNQNSLIGTASREDVHAKGLFHRSVHVLLFNSGGELLMQRRADDKDVCPGRWDLSAAEHLKPGETTLQAAFRGLEEELGICAPHAPQLELWRPYRLQTYHSKKLGITDNEFVETYLGEYEGELVMDSIELSALEYRPLNQLEKAVDQRPHTFTPWFQNEFAYYLGQTKTAR